MNKERNALKAGLFIVATLVLSVVVIVSIKGVGRFTEGRVSRTVSFKLSDDIGGLRVGDDVRVGGFKVGAVTGIEPAGLDTPEPRLLVTFGVPQRFAPREGARVGVQVTLTGSPSINVESLGTGRPLADGEQIAGHPDPKSVLLASLGEAGTDLRGVAKDLRTTTIPKVNAAVDSFKSTGDGATALVANVNGKVDPAMAKYHTVGDKTGAMMDTIREWIGPTTTDFKGTLANLNVATGAIKDKLPGMLTKVETAVDGATRSLDELEKTLGNTKHISENVKGVLGRNEGKIEGVIASVKTTGDNLKAASNEIRHSPWRLLYQPKTGELSNLNLFDSARQFAEGANDLNDAAQALKDAIKTGGTSDAEMQKLVDRLEKTFANFRQVEQKLWQDVK